MRRRAIVSRPIAGAAATVRRARSVHGVLALCAAIACVSAVACNGTVSIGVSKLGAGWSVLTASASFGARSDFGAATHGGKLWLFGGRGAASSDVWSSADGSAWTSVTSNAPFAATGTRAVEHAGALWVTDDTSFWSSTDGANWTNVTRLAAFSSRTKPGFADVDGTLWIVGGQTRTSGFALGDVYSSTDGVNWTNTTTSPPFGRRTGAAVLGFRGKLWVIAGMSGTYATQDVCASDDGVHWTITAPSTPFAGAVSGAVLGNQMWIVDGAGVTYSSPDGEAWSTLGQVPLGGAALLDAALLGSGTSLFVVGGSVGGVDRANVFVSSATP